jgi:hypothetical protein
MQDGVLGACARVKLRDQQQLSMAAEGAGQFGEAFPVRRRGAARRAAIPAAAG